MKYFFPLAIRCIYSITQVPGYDLFFRHSGLIQRVLAQCESFSTHHRQTSHSQLGRLSSVAKIAHPSAVHLYLDYQL